MKTAEEFLVRDELFKTPLTEEEKHYYIDRIITHDDYIKGMIEFAKMHVQEALEKAYLNSEMRVSENDNNEYPSFTNNYDDGYVTITVSKDSILNAYPLENII